MDKKQAICTNINRGCTVSFSAADVTKKNIYALGNIVVFGVPQKKLVLKVDAKIVFSMTNIFRSSFLSFLESLHVDFIEQENTFSFPDHNFIIFLEYISTSYRSVKAPEHWDVLYLYEDRWMYGSELMQERILLRLKRFRSVFARKCKVLFGKELVGENGAVICVDEAVPAFLEQYHAYGTAKSKYKYALMYEDKIVAVASFSQSRPMVRRIFAPFLNVPSNEIKTVNLVDDIMQYSYNDAITFHSYEWIRYASLPDVRVVGGMGKLLNAFLKDVNKDKLVPTEVMTYSDNEWSSGDVYEKLGFSFAGERAPVQYYVCCKTYERMSERKLIKLYNSLFMNEKKIEKASELPQSFLCDFYKIRNKGSKKFLIQRPMLQPRSSLYSV